MKKLMTIGHSTRTIEEFISILKAYGITQLVDIRAIPKSRRNPQYGQDELRDSLKNVGIKYVYSKDLGGLRPATRPSQNEGWENTSFRNYADYMQTDQFQIALNELIDLSEEYPTVIMCAEAVPWRCHRRLVGDAFLIRGIPVKDIFDAEKAEPHRRTPFAVVEGTNITYPKPDKAE